LAAGRSLINAFVGAVEVNALVQGALRRVTQWSWIEHANFQLRGGLSSIELLAAVTLQM